MEILPGAVGTGETVFAAILVLGFRYRVFAAKVTAVEIAGTALILWLVARMTAVSLAEGYGVSFASLRDAMAIFAGLILFRLARNPELRGAIIRGVGLGLVLGLGLEAYQILVGLPTLRAHGYIPPQFNYDTASGAYRPFGGFYTPVIFGASLAMSLGLLIFSGPSRKKALLILAGVAGLILTYTRGAWLGLAAAVLVGLLAASPAIRKRMAVASVPLAYFGLIGILMFPAALSGPLERFMTIGDSEYGSNSIRVDLWEGVLRVVGEKPVAGYGPASFADVMNPQIGLTLAQFGHPHNTFLMVLFQYGFIGLLLLVALIVTLLVSVLKLPGLEYPHKVAGLAVLVTFLASSFTETTWGSFHLLTFLFLGVGFAFGRRGHQPLYASLHGATSEPATPRIPGLRSR